MENENRTVVRNLSLVGVVGNLVLVAFKLFAGIWGKSGAMLSDAVHSLSDVFATAVAWLGTRMSQKEPDKNHPYGHDRYECLASMLLGCILFVTGLGIGWSGVRTVLAGNYDALKAPKMIALIAAATSIVTKEAMYRYTRYYAEKLHSSVFMADAWHHRSDALSSVGSLIGIAGARLGFPVLDSIAQIVICFFILWAAVGILKDAVEKLLDTSCGEAFDAELRTFIAEQPGVDRIELLQSRQFGDKKYIDVIIGVNGELPLSEAHGIAEAVHDAVESRYPDIKHIMIHENPTEE